MSTDPEQIVDQTLSYITETISPQVQALREQFLSAVALRGMSTQDLRAAHDEQELNKARLAEQQAQELRIEEHLNERYRRNAETVTTFISTLPRYEIWSPRQIPCFACETSDEAIALQASTVFLGNRSLFNRTTETFIPYYIIGLDPVTNDLLLAQTHAQPELSDDYPIAAWKERTEKQNIAGKSYGSESVPNTYPVAADLPQHESAIYTLPMRPYTGRHEVGRHHDGTAKLGRRERKERDADTARIQAALSHGHQMQSALQDNRLVAMYSPAPNTQFSDNPLLRSDLTPLTTTEPYATIISSRLSRLRKLEASDLYLVKNTTPGTLHTELLGYQSAHSSMVLSDDTWIRFNMTDYLTGLATMFHREEALKPVFKQLAAPITRSEATE